jgi:hypothetical protein
MNRQKRAAALSLNNLSEKIKPLQIKWIKEPVEHLNNVPFNTIKLIPNIPRTDWFKAQILYNNYTCLLDSLQEISSMKVSSDTLILDIKTRSNSIISFLGSVL